MIYNLAVFLAKNKFPAQFLYRWFRTARQDQPVLERFLLQRILSYLSRYMNVNLRIRVQSSLDLDFSKGLIFCAAHTGLTMAIFSFIEQQGRVPVLVSHGNGTHAFGWNWGCHTPLKLIYPGQMTLVHARTALKAGCGLVVYPDVPTQNPLYDLAIVPNFFKFALKTNTPLVFFDAELASNGDIVLVFRAPTALTTAAEEFRVFVEERLQVKCCFSDNTFRV